jgi:fused signal recognition particle receptor
MSTTWREIFDLGARDPASPDAEPESEERRRGVFRRLRASLSKSRQALVEEISASLFDRIDEETWERLEEALIMADAGVPTTAEVVERLEQEVDSGVVSADGEAVRERLIEILAEVASNGRAPIDLSGEPAVLLMVGVNGTGKTTTIAKLAARLGRDGTTVLLAAADTFRAAAVEQLRAWAERLELPVVAHAPGADPGAVVFDSLDAASARGIAVVIADTAGRLHTKRDLMNELTKIRRVIERRLPGSRPDVLLVLDATTGQNGLHQARVFNETVGVSGIVVTKMDSTARAGIVFAIEGELQLPVLFLGTGESVDDLEPFDPQRFVAALFEG